MILISHNSLYPNYKPAKKGDKQKVGAGRFDMAIKYTRFVASGVCSRLTVSDRREMLMAIEGTPILQALNRCLDDLHQQTGAFIQSYQHRPAESSAAARERQTFAKPELITSVHSQGILRIEVAGDHMIALGRAISEPVLVFPAWVCVRALLEASASAAWLLDPGIDADTRVRRSYSLRFEGLIQQKKIRSGTRAR